MATLHGISYPKALGSQRARLGTLGWPKELLLSVNEIRGAEAGKALCRDAIPVSAKPARQALVL